MTIVDERIERYILEHSTAQNEQMQTHQREARASLPSPGMLSGPVVGRLLELLVHTAQAKLVLEIGTYAGYSTLAMAAGLPPGGHIVTCEIAEQHARFADEHIARSAYAEQIDVRVGPALQTIATLDGPFDFVFIDAEKSGYPAYYEAVLEKLSPHALIAVDNTLRDGDVLDGEAARDSSTQAIVRFNEMLARDDRVNCVILSVRDGITLIRRR